MRNLYFYHSTGTNFPYGQNYTDTNGTREYQIVYPGKSKEDFNIDLDGNKLIIRAGEHKTNYVLPEDIDKKNIKAEYVAGILKIALPRKPTKAPVSIKIT